MDTDAWYSNFSISTSSLRGEVIVDRDRCGRSSRRAEQVTMPWAHWSKERQIRRAVRALALLDDCTLRGLGILSRSDIEFTVRFCVEC